MTNNIQAAPGEAEARRLESVDAQLGALLREPDVARRLRDAPGENEWSAMQILGHVAEVIPYWMGQCRALIAASGEPPHFGRAADAPERLAGPERSARGNPDEMLQRVDSEVRAAARAIRQMSAAERAKSGVHLRLGPMTVADSLEKFVVGHCEEHLAQVRAALRA
jgi:uncharacterized damage-inducible protein DinB